MARTKIASETIADWKERAETWIASNYPGHSVTDITTGVDAWTVAHKCEFTREAYDMSRDILDAHIQTALEQVFPNAVFRDAKRY